MKKFIKNNLKTILVVGVTAIICISGTAFATGYLAKDILYKDNKTVEDALNELYNKTSKTRYQITNLINNGSFENGSSGWINNLSTMTAGVGGTISTTNPITGKKSLKIVDKSSSVSFWNFQLIDEKSKVDDIYYFFVEKSKDSTIISLSLRGKNVSFKDYVKGNDLETRISRMCKMSTSESVYLQFGSSLAETNINGYYDNVTVINLTKTFGAGNEPNIDWCDSNIDYFDGTTYLYK